MDIYKSTVRISTSDVIEFRVPLKSEYLPVLRATTGVVAGVLSFNYDEVMQLRLAVSQLFELAIEYLSCTSAAGEMDVRFLIHPDKMEILLLGPRGYTSHLNWGRGRETLALLQSLVDEIEFGAEIADRTLIHIVKYRSLKSVTWQEP